MEHDGMAIERMVRSLLIVVLLLPAAWAQEFFIASPHSMVATSPLQIRLPVKAENLAYYFDGASKIVDLGDQGCDIEAKPGDYKLRIVRYVIVGGEIKKEQFAERSIRIIESMTQTEGPARQVIEDDRIITPMPFAGVEIEMTISGDPKFHCQTCEEWRAAEPDWYRSQGARVKYKPVTGEAIPTYTITWAGQSVKYASATKAYLDRETFKRLFAGLRE